MIKLRPARDRFIAITDADCLEILGITDEQLKIAKALDRYKVETIAAWITAKMQDNYSGNGHTILSWLPNFSDEVKHED